MAASAPPAPVYRSCWTCGGRRPVGHVCSRPHPAATRGRPGAISRTIVLTALGWEQAGYVWLDGRWQKRTAG